MAKPDMDQPQRDRRDREMDDLPEEKSPGDREHVRGVGDEDEVEEAEDFEDEEEEEDFDR